ncbi:hypothetical protein [Prosthecobacter sp.]|uniref:hypothetical protein n=1 Tax=Prosthecobacter sp. TaxID=1965333 RepID=UPI003782DB82
MHRYKIHFTVGGASMKEADRCTLDGPLVCLYRGDSLTAVIPRRMVTRIEEQAGEDAAEGDPLFNWMNVLGQMPPGPPLGQ